LFVVGVVVYGAVAGDRLWKQSGAPHFVFQADAWVHGRQVVAGQRLTTLDQAGLLARVRELTRDWVAS
jgi:hypothetical protein